MLVYTYTYTLLKIDILNFGFVRDINLIRFLLGWKFFVHEFRYKTEHIYEAYVSVYIYIYAAQIRPFNIGPVRDINLIPFYCFGNFLHMNFDIRRKTYMKRMLGYVSVHINIYAAQNRHFHLRPCKRYQFNFFYYFGNFLYMDFYIRRKTYIKLMLNYVSVYMYVVLEEKIPPYAVSPL